MQIVNHILESVGKTPLIRLQRMVEPGMATVLVKAEHLNPSGSVKDRMALHVLQRAAAKGLLQPGGTIIEATAGNTGLALAMAAAVLGYRAIFTVPDKFSSEKINMLKAYGAEVIITPTAVHNNDPQSWTQVAQRLAKEIPNSFYVSQFSNLDNIDAHYEITGPEIWHQTEGKIDVFIAGAGTGGTVVGTGRYLKEQAAANGRTVHVVCPDIEGSIYFSKFYNRPPQAKKSYRLEGLGNDFLPECLDFGVIDEMRQYGDRESFLTARRLTKEEGLFVGGSSGLNVAAALDIARELGPGKTVVTILCDAGYRYMSKSFSDSWMRDWGYMEQPRIDNGEATAATILGPHARVVEYANPDEHVSTVVSRMTALGISQLPLRRAAGEPLTIVSENDLLKQLLEGRVNSRSPVKEAARQLQEIAELNTPLAKLEAIISKQGVAIVINEDEIAGIISKIDLVRFLSDS